MDALGWLTTNANALSGYVVLIVVVVGFIWAIATGRLVSGKHYTETHTALANCLKERETP